MILLFSILWSWAVCAQQNSMTLTSNLNIFKSNIYRIIYPESVMQVPNTEALGKELDKQGCLVPPF